MQENNTTEIRNFLEKFIIQEIGRLQKEGFHYVSFVIIGQAIETLGSFLDSKPLRAKFQSKKRFSLALQVLFDRKYSRLNDKDWLYEKLRCDMTHLLFPSSHLLLVSQQTHPQKQHLGEENGQITLVAEVFYADLCTACQKLLKRIDEGKVSSKKFNTSIHEDNF